MAVRYPLVIDTTDNNKIKELPLNDSLNLNTNSIVNAVNITASGTLTVANLVVDSTSVTINGTSLATVAQTNSYTDLDNRPILFDGQYSSLSGRPTIPSNIEDLANVGSTAPANGQALVYSTTLGRYEPGSIADVAIDLSNQNISELQDVVISSASINQVLKYNGTAFVNASVEFSEITSRPTTLAGYGITDAMVAGTPHDGDITGSVFGDDSTLLVDSINNKIVGTVDANISRSGTLVVSGDSVNIVTTAGGLLLSSSAGATLLGSGTTSIVSSSGQIDITANSAVNLSGSLFNVFTGMTVRNGIDGDLTGSVFADDSTLLVDGVSGTIPAANLTGALPAIDGSALTGITATANNLVGDMKGSVFGDDSTLLIDGVNNTINGIVQGGLQELVGPGVVNLTTTSTEIVTTGTDAYTLANGTYGQIKHIIKIGGPGAATITPASFANGTSVELASDFNCVSLLYTNSGWAVIAAQNITINA